MAVNCRMKFKASSRLVLIGLVIELWVLTIYSIAITGLALFLYSNHLMDSTMAPGVLFSFLGSILSLVYVLSHCLLSTRFRSAGLRRPTKTRLDSACSNLPRLLILLWIVATATGLVVASRRPICLPDAASAVFWVSGTSCRMHRTITALSVLALISTCSIFCVNELSEKSFYASLTGYHKAALLESITIASDLRKKSFSISSTSSSSTFDKNQKLYHVYDLESNVAAHSSWLQRRDSISSQRAMYPHSLLPGNSYNRPRSLRAMAVLDEDATATLTRTATMFNSNLKTTTSALLKPVAYSHPAHMLPMLSSPTTTRSSPLSTVHHASRPEISIDLLSKTLDPNSSSWEKPTIRHIPLSDDPAIRKLAEGGEPNDSSSGDDDTRHLVGLTGSSLPKGRSIRRNQFPDVTRSTTSSLLPPPPTLPSRAADHSAVRRVPVPRTASIVSSGSVQSDGNFSVRRPPTATRWSQQRGRRQWTYRNASAYGAGHRSYASMSSWYTDTIHE